MENQALPFVVQLEELANPTDDEVESLILNSLVAAEALETVAVPTVC
jgi:hypothetical protein